MEMMLPLLFAAMATYVGWTTLQGFRTGEMEPITKGLHLTAERKTRPRWFWAAALWNVLLFGCCLWAAVGSAADR